MARRYETAWIMTSEQNSCRVEYFDGRKEEHRIRALRVIQQLNDQGWWVSAADYGAVTRFVMTREVD